MASFEWIDADGRFRLALGPRPRQPLFRELFGWRNEGVQRLVSLQTEEESARMGLGDEPATAQMAGLSFDRFAIRDHAVPDDPQDALRFAHHLYGCLESGEAVLLHCYAGIGRSGLMAILTLMVAGFAYEDAQRRATDARGLPVPENALQLAWLQRMSTFMGAG